MNELQRKCQGKERGLQLAGGQIRAKVMANQILTLNSNICSNFGTRPAIAGKAISRLD